MTQQKSGSDSSSIYLVNAIIGFIFAASGPVAIILTVGAKGGLTEADLSSWIFGSFFINGILSISFCLYFRQPLVFFWTIPGTVLVGSALTHLTFPEVIGAFIATGVIMAVLGLTGWVQRMMDLIPMPIVMAMVGGVFLQFGLDLIYAFRDDFWITAPMALAFLVLSFIPALGRLMPPLIGALIVGTLSILVLGGFDQSAVAATKFALPNVYEPVFSLEAMIELVVPLVITVLVVQNGQGFAILRAVGHKPPVTPITIACGVFSILTAFVGTVSTCLTGPVNALISASGEHHRHYQAGVIVGILALVFGLMSPLFTSILLATPPAFIAGLAGLAMMRVLQTAMNTAFGSSFTLGALVTFLVTVADVPIFGLGAPFWGLVFGYIISLLLERQDFHALYNSQTD